MDNIVEFVESDSGWPDDLRADVDKINAYPCQTCKRPFRTCEGLRSHFCWECKECALIFRTSSELKAHPPFCQPVDDKRRHKAPRGRYGKKEFSNG